MLPFKPTCCEFSVKSKFATCSNLKPTHHLLSLMYTQMIFNDNKPVQIAVTFQALIYMFGTLDLT
jgi:hypothetical protein